MKGPRTLETRRLILRKPRMSDAPAIFERYARDPEVTRYLSWPAHKTVADTSGFLAWSDADWELWPAGSFLVHAREENGRLLGGTGLSFRTPDLAVTGYVFARDAWGKGFATEALGAMVALARALRVKRLEAICHVDHRASARVLEKCGFECQGVRPKHSEFPNLAPGTLSDVFSYALRCNSSE
jgi:[ribosomal protein S5]-alanine N-acetyltransferase